MKDKRLREAIKFRNQLAILFLLTMPLGIFLIIKNISIGLFISCGGVVLGFCFLGMFTTVEKLKNS